MVRYIDAEPLEAEQYKGFNRVSETDWQKGYWSGIDEMCDKIKEQPTADVVEVVHGRWILEAHDERVNYRWNVTAECSECCDEQKEIWAGFFPNVPPSIARDVALVSAESVKLSNYCPNCGAKMDGKKVE